MSLDSRDKRASSVGWGLASLLVLPAPGTLDQPDRQHVAYSYRGIAASTPVSVTLPSYTYTATWQATATYTATWQTTATYESEWD